MSKVFISYSHVDSEIVDLISTTLADLQIEYFRDKKDIQWGNSINQKVQKAIEECFAILVVISPASLKSQWVPFELGHASALKKVILPYLTHPSIDVPQYISDLNYVTSIDQAKEFFSKVSTDQLISDNQSDTTLSNDAIALLLETSKDKNGRLMKSRNSAGLDISTNGKNFTEENTPRTDARWEEAIELLRNNNLIVDKGTKGEVFAITSSGFKIADQLVGEKSLEWDTLDKFQRDYFLEISKPRNDGFIYNGVHNQTGRETAKHEEALIVFQQHELMINNGEGYKFTKKGWDYSDQLWWLKILDSLELNIYLDDQIIAKELGLTDGKVEMEKLEIFVQEMEERDWVEKVETLDDWSLLITQKGLKQKRRRKIKS